MCTGSGVLAARAREGRPLPSSRCASSTRSAKSIPLYQTRIQPGQLPTCATSATSVPSSVGRSRQTPGQLSGSLAGGGGFPDQYFGWRRFSRDISAALLKLLMQRDFGNQDNVGEVDELTMEPQRPAKNAEAKSRAGVSRCHQTSPAPCPGSTLMWGGRNVTPHWWAPQ